jgi:hypothetical protein
MPRDSSGTRGGKDKRRTEEERMRFKKFISRDKTLKVRRRRDPPSRRQKRATNSRRFNYSI